MLERIGSGPMAEVWQAREAGHEGSEPVALKRFVPEVVRDEEVLSILFDEAMVAQALDHENICAFFELGHVKDDHFFITELVPGFDLSELSTTLKAPAPIGPALRIARQLCRALDAGHRAGAVHGNLAPTNVRVRPDGRVVVTDFCIGRAAHFLLEGKTRALKRRYGYMAPEQVRGNPGDQRSDIFALGALLYELLTGAPAFRGANELATLDLVRRGELVPPRQRRPELPATLEDLLLGALAPDPADRPPSARQLQATLAELDADLGPGTTDEALADWLRSCASAS